MSSTPPAYRQGETYWCEPDPQDTIGSEQAGNRIWLIVSQRTRNKCVVALPLSRHTEKAGPPFLIPVPSSEITVIDGSGAYDRVALTDQIRCLDKSRLSGQCGSVSRRALYSVLSGIDNMLGRSYVVPH